VNERMQTQVTPAKESFSFAPTRSGLLQRKCACGGTPGPDGECAECRAKRLLGLQRSPQEGSGGRSGPSEVPPVVHEVLASSGQPLDAATRAFMETLFGHDFSQIPVYSKAPVKLLAKFTDAPGDVYEREADRIADQVMATPAHHAVSGAPPRIQRFSGQPNRQMDAAPASVDKAVTSPGRPLEPALRQDMEQRFGHDFSRVRVHSGAVAEQSAQDVNANAYTVGHNMVFGTGRFAPGTREGRRLIAHELTHVVQQSGADRMNDGQSNDKRGLSPNSHIAHAVLQRKPDGKSPTEAADPIDEENFPEYAWHLVGSISGSTRPGAAVVRTSVAEHTGIDRDLLSETTAKFVYRKYVKGGTIRPSYTTFRHPTKGIVARAFAEREGSHPDREPDPENKSLWYKVYVFSRHSSKDPTHYAFPMPLSSAPPRPLDEQELREYERWHKALWPDHKHLAKGIMEWRLEPSKTFSQFGKGGWTKRQIQVKFTPDPPFRAKTITFLQTVLQTKGGTTSTPSKKPKIDVLPEEFDPFYGMEWDPKMKKWVPESAPKGYKSAPSSPTDRTAYLYDEPYAPPGQVKMFETVAVVPETGETLGALRWGVGKGAERVDCTDAPSADFGAAVERFYATPTAVGPESGREARYDVILEGFTANDATLTADQEKQLDPIVTKVKRDPKLMVEVGGFADATETDPGGISEQRAQAVASYLIGNGVPKDNTRVTGFGATWARYAPSAREGRNRRVQLRLHY
jgi:hypothetical protein